MWVGTNVLEEHAASIFTVKVSQVGEVDGYSEETRKRTVHAPLPINRFHKPTGTVQDCRCHENLKSLQKPVQSKIKKPALLEVQTVNKSSVWNLNNKNGASLLKAALLLMSSVLTLQEVGCHINFILCHPLDRVGLDSVEQSETSAPAKN